MLGARYVKISTLCVIAGKVKSVVRGKDGVQGTVYEVDYREEGVYDVDHLLEDYLEGSLSILS